MGIDRTFGLAFAKSQTARGQPAAASRARCSSRSPTATRTAGLRRGPPLRRARLRDRGHRRHRRARSRRAGIPVDTGRRQGRRGRSGVDAVDLIASGKVDLVVNTPRGRGPRADGAHIRRAAIATGIPCVTTVAAALAAAAGHRRVGADASPTVRSLQEYHRDGQLRLEVVTPMRAAVDRDAGRPRRRRSGRSRCRTRSSPRRARSGTAPSWRGSCDPARLGAVTVKSLARRTPWPGNPRAAAARGPPAAGCSTRSACRARASSAWLARRPARAARAPARA